jgi:hypothetical protein
MPTSTTWSQATPGVVGVKTDSAHIPMSLRMFYTGHWAAATVCSLMLLCWQHRCQNMGG